MNSLPLCTRFLMMLFLAMIFTGCERDFEQGKAIQGMVSYPDTYLRSAASGVEVLISNQLTGYSRTTLSCDQGNFRFEDLPYGIYTISAVRTLLPGEAMELTGLYTEIMLGAQLTSVYVYEGGETSFNLQLSGSAAGDLVFKEIFYTGSRTPNDGTYFADQFMEIYNNSTEPIYVDGLLISDIMGNPSGPNPSPWRNDHDHVYAQTIWRVPGGGQDHLLQPGESILIAQNGLDHREENANSIDLSYPVADFEYYVEREDGRDFDNPGVPNMILEHFAFMGTDYVIHVRGPGMVIWRCDDIDALERVTRPGGSSTALYVKIPVEMVIDGVEALADAGHAANKRIPPSIDAGFVYCSGTYVNESIRRKVSALIDGRIVLQDTNNSSNDFEVVSPPTPKAF